MDPVSKSQAADNSVKQRIGRPFPKGVSGNPGGRPKKNHITRMYEELLAKSQNRKDIKESALKVLTGGRMATVLLLREMAERTEGKVAQEVDMNVTGTVVLGNVILERRKKRASGNSQS
jgi:hypothetical protein